MPEAAGLAPSARRHLHLGVDVAGGFPGAAPPHGIEGDGFVRLLVDGVGGLGGRGRARPRGRARVDFGGQLRLGGHGRLGPGRLGRQGEKARPGEEGASERPRLGGGCSPGARPTSRGPSPPAGPAPALDPPFAAPLPLSQSLQPNTSFCSPGPSFGVGVTFCNFLTVGL